jgi:oligoribonuclease NrnB/cAMP/cGMP phosphodiesterase (DHH superfamily)
LQFAGINRHHHHLQESKIMWKPDICLHHFPGDDGFAAAWVVNRKWPDVVLKGTNYGLPFPEVDIDGKNILIADFSYKPDELATLSARAKSIIILDHHKTADVDLRDVRRIVGANCANVEAAFGGMAGPGMNVLAEFDMARSGASLAWQFCFPGERMPQLIRYVEDRDLWLMKLEHTRSLSLLLQSYPYDLAVWNELMLAFDDVGGAQAGVLTEARAIERFFDRRLAELLPTAVFKQIGKWKGIPVAYAPYAFASDLANALLKAHPDAPFAAVVVEAYGARTYSLRSEDGRQDVSEVARTFGGGGHRNAAGFRVPA